jgi:cation diffusion facilitator CzcD-associated flavoprotein CzcO
VTAKKYGAEKYIKTRHMVTGAKWLEDKAVWPVQVRDFEANREFTDTCDFLVVAIGIFNHWKWPDIPGLKSFQGKLLHSADWDDSYDIKDKEIALIGGGSSGIQILPTLQPIAKRIDH